MLTGTFKSSQWLSAKPFQAFELDYLVLGNGFLEKRSCRCRRFLELRHSLGKDTRCGMEVDDYYFLGGFVNEHQYPRDAVFHLREPDLHQEVYGQPQYLGAIQSAFLNEEATLFRRGYFANGSHAGFILYVTDAAQSQDDIDAIPEKLMKSKGAGNFKNLF